MDTNELMSIVHAEDLEVPVIYGAGVLHAEVVVLERDVDQWTVFVANERGGAIESTRRTFDNESDALEHVLRKVRQGTKYHRALQASPDGPR